MRATRRHRAALCAAAFTLSGCPGLSGTDGGDVVVAHDVSTVDAVDAFTPPDVPRATDVIDVPDVPDAGPVLTNIEHVLIIVQENHAFDTYFGRYCTAAPGSAPSCTDGPACCEAAPATEPSGAMPTVLDDTENAAYDPNHTQPCENEEIHGGAMDRFVTGASCSDARNFALAPVETVATYHGYARNYALADRYFQPIVGQSSANDMYLAVAQRVFTDNQYKPSTLGQGCTLPASEIQYTGQTTIADLILDAGYRFAFYAEGYAAMRASSTCPAAPSDCHFGLPTTPCDYDPSDVPFEYYRQFADNPSYMKDYNDLLQDIAQGSLPNVAYLKLAGYHNEHPGYRTRISDGIAAVDTVVQRVLASPQAAHTLILLTWDEGGGFFDHVSPPPDPSPVDHEHYGTRIPLIAIGRFARRNHVSHVVLEHSSIVRFLEFNFLGAVGQLHARDARVHNLGSMLDATQTGITVPED